MNYISWQSLLFYCFFCVFVYYQQQYLRNFRGGTQLLGSLISISVGLAVVTSLIYLIYYGWHVVWWVPIIIFFVGFVFSLISMIAEPYIGSVVSMLGFLGWPICAYFMFQFIPKLG